MTNSKNSADNKGSSNTQLNSKALYLRLLTWVKPYWKRFGIAILAMIVYAATEPAMPALIKPMLDGSFVEKDPQIIRLIPLAIIALFVIRGITNYLSTVSLSWVSNRVIMDLRNHMFHRLLSLPSTYYDHQSSGNIISKVTYNVTQVTSAATDVLIVVVRDSLAVIGLLAWMFYLNWKLALLIFLVAPVVVGIVKVISTRLRKLSQQLQSSMGDLTHVLEEAVNGHKVVKIFGGQEYEKKRFNAVSNWIRRYEIKIISTSAANVPIVQMVIACTLAFVIFLATTQSGQEAVTVGGFVSFFGAMAMLFAPIKRLTSLNDRVQRGLAAAESIFALMDEPVEEDRGQQKLESASGRIQMRNVQLRYISGAQSALDGIDLDIAPGETIALVGRSGSGKSSLVNLIPRFYNPTGGQIVIDGIDAQQIELSELRRNIALVSQEVTLFNDTVAANIAYGAGPEPSLDKVRAAADAANATEFVEKMPEGFLTLIGERGMRLSGGQRQRLAIARAIMKDAKILIMDEATSALDSESERLVQSALERLRKGRTTLVIAHRLSTIENADRIVVMENGRIVEIGTHRQLLAANGQYAALHKAQFTEAPVANVSAADKPHSDNSESH